MTGSWLRAVTPGLLAALERKSCCSVTVLADLSPGRKAGRPELLVTGFALPGALSAPWRGGSSPGQNAELVLRVWGLSRAALAMSCSHFAVPSEGWAGSKSFLRSLGAKERSSVYFKP